MKKIILIMLLFASNICFSQNKDTVSIFIDYNYVSDFFNYVDNLSNWQGKTSNNYAAFWQQEYLNKKGDEKYLKQYREIRRKYDKSTDFNLFNHSTEDVIANAFYRSSNFNEAYNKLVDKIDQQDLKSLINSINYFKERINFILTKDNHINNTRELKKEISQHFNNKDVTQYIKNICAFYGVEPEKINLAILIVWRLPTIPGEGSANNDTILISWDKANLRSNKEKLEFMSIVLHEVTHHISMLAPEKNKKEFTRYFLKNFHNHYNFNDNNAYKFIEEPLAVILGQMIFLRTFAPEYYEHYDNWYNDPWIQTLAKLTEPLVVKYFNEHRAIDMEFMKQYSIIASEVTKAAKTF